MAWSINDVFVATGSSDKKIKIWNTETGELVKTLNDHKDIVYSVEFNPNNNYLYSGGIDNFILIWNT